MKKRYIAKKYREELEYEMSSLWAEHVEICNDLRTNNVHDNYSVLEQKDDEILQSLYTLEDFLKDYYNYEVIFKDGKAKIIK